MFSLLHDNTDAEGTLILPDHLQRPLAFGGSIRIPPARLANCPVICIVAQQD